MESGTDLGPYMSDVRKSTVKRRILTGTYLLQTNIYVLGVFTEKPYSKPLERDEVYIPIITLSRQIRDVK